MRIMDGDSQHRNEVALVIEYIRPNAAKNNFKRREETKKALPQKLEPFGVRVFNFSTNDAIETAANLYKVKLELRKCCAIFPSKIVLLLLL